MNKYFVAYFYRKGEAWGFGRCDVTVSFEIKGADEVKIIEDSMIEKMGFDGCAIINYKKVGADNE